MSAARTRRRPRVVGLIASRYRFIPKKGVPEGRIDRS